MRQLLTDVRDGRHSLCPSSDRLVEVEKGRMEVSEV
jgi:hypothetical protein